MNTAVHNKLVSFIWSIAETLRGHYKQSEYGKVILPFTVLRRLDAVLEPTKSAVLAKIPALPPNIDDAMLRFENYERKMDDLEGQIESYDMGQKTLSEEIEELESDERIDEELKALKARMGGGAAGSAPAAGGANARDEGTPSAQS